MQAPARRQALARLLARLDGVEPGAARPARGGAAPYALAPGALHALHAAERDAGALWSFALGQAAAFLCKARPSILWLGLAPAAELAGLPYPPGFAPFGLRPDALAYVAARTPRELLWAAEEAAASPALAAVIAELAGETRLLDFTASRRLALRAKNSGTPVLLLRLGAGPEPSAARTRWRIAPFPAAPDPFDPAAPGAPRWRVTLEKGFRGEEGCWTLSWSGQTFRAHENDENADERNGSGNRAGPQAPGHPGPHLPLLGHRLRGTR